MATADEQKTPGVFTCTWSIHNFSRCTSRANESFGSTFCFRNIEWRLSLYPKVMESPGFLSFYLHPIDYKKLQSPGNNNFMYVLSLRRCNGIFRDLLEISVPSAYSPTPESQNFISLEELYEPDAYVDHDVLTLHCRLWKIDADLSESVNCFARTKIKVAKLNHLWIVNDLANCDGTPKKNFNRTTDVLIFSKEFAGVKLHLSTGGTFGDDAIYFAIDRHKNPDCYYGESELLFAVYHIKLLSSGSVVQSISGEVSFQNSSDIRKFPFLSKRKLFANKESYLLGGKLTLQCELSFSGKFEVESVEYGRNAELNLNYSKDMKPSLKKVQSVYELWKENLRQFYCDGKFTDLIVRTPNQEFPVHRAILCAQSEVFRGMLSHDMKEKNSGVFEISDFKDDTVSKLLLYLYTNTVEDIDYASAKDLYFAADKYQIKPLQKICSKHLMESMNTSNVCDILLVADQLRDQELKSTARDLIVPHAHKIINSDGWKSLKITNVDLITETTEWMILNKLPK